MFGVFAALLILIGIVLSIDKRSHEPLVFSLLGAVSLPVVYLRARYWLPWDLRRRWANTLVGSRRLRIGTEGFYVGDRLGMSHYDWNEIEEAQIEEEYALLYMTSRLSIVVPRQGVTSGSYDALTKELGKHVPSPKL